MFKTHDSLFTRNNNYGVWISLHSLAAHTETILNKHASDPRTQISLPSSDLGKQLPEFKCRRATRQNGLHLSSFDTSFTKRRTGEGNTPHSYSYSGGFWLKSRQINWLPILTEVFYALPQSLKVNDETVSQITPRPLPSIFIPTYYSLIVPPFHAI